jgi:hypothetical protein
MQELWIWWLWKNDCQRPAMPPVALWQTSAAVEKWSETTKSALSNENGLGYGAPH